jgi:hypothetical protein
MDERMNGPEAAATNEPTPEPTPEPGPEPGPEPVRPLAPAPADIEQMAARAGLGPLVTWQRGPHPFATFARSLAYSIGWLLGLCVVGWVASRFDSGPLGLVALPFLAGAIVAFIKAVRNLLVGFTATYLYAHGLIGVKNGRPTVITWPEVDRLNVAYFAGEMVCYRVVTVDGRTARIELDSAEGDPSVGLMVAHKVEELGRPIVATGPSSKRAHR